MLCEVMNVNRSGYYKWKKRKDIPNRYEQTNVQYGSKIWSSSSTIQKTT